MVKGDTLPKYEAQFTRNGVAVPIPDGAVVLFVMREHRTGAIKTQATAFVENASLGKVSYTFDASDTDTPGTYFIRFVQSLGSAVQTIPNDQSDILIVSGP